MESPLSNIYLNASSQSVSPGTNFRPKNFIFYDLETSGRSSKFDQLLQFAAIITDDQFNEIKRVNVRCKLAPHILPSPIALHITGVSPNQLYDEELPNAFEFSQFLQSFIKDNSPATWIGFNSIAFDENFLRQFFYQNLQPELYATQSFGNDRLDVIKMVWAVYNECNSALDWPLNDKGKVSFKLEHLAPANGFLNANSHDALSDVEATVFLMQKIKRQAPDLVGELIATRQKSYIKSLIETNLPLKVTLRFGGAPKTITGCFCGYHKNNSNSFGFLDLKQEGISELLSASYEEVFKALSNSPQKIKTLSLNKADTIRPFKDAPNDLVQLSRKVGANRKFALLVGEALSNKYQNAELKNKTIEDQIYDRFVSSHDKSLLFIFQEASWSERQYILEGFEDMRLKILARRLITFYGPKLNYGNWDDKFTDYLYSKWIDAEDEEWNTFQKFDKDLEHLRSTNADEEFIDDLVRLKARLAEQLLGAKI